MEVAMLQYPPGDPRMIDTIVHQLKSQGIFDQFRKECIADVDTKPAYQNLHQRVEGTVSGFLAHQVWRPDLNKNQVRESLRKHILESGYLDLGVERIVDQVVNPKIMTVLVPQVEDVVYKFIGIEKPKKAPVNHTSIAHRDLLPKDLDPVSPESDDGKKSPSNSIEDGEFDERDKVGETPPPFNALENSNDNSMGSHLSGISGLTSPDGHLSNISYIGGKTPPRKSFEGDSNHSRISMESVRSLSAMEVEHSEAYNILELDPPTTYERMVFEKPSRLERPAPDKPSSFEREEAEKVSRFEQAEAEKAEKQRIYERAEAERRMSYEGLEVARRGSCSESETEFETSSDEESSPEHEPLDGSMSPIGALHIDLDRADVNKADSTAGPANDGTLASKAEPKVVTTGDGKLALKDGDMAMASPKEKCNLVDKELKVKDEPKAKPKEVEEKARDKPAKKVEKEELKPSKKEIDKTDKDVKKSSVKDVSVKKEEKKRESEGHARKSDKDKDPKRQDNAKKTDTQPKGDAKKEEKPAKKSEKGEKDDLKKEDVKKEDKTLKKDEKSKKDEKGGRKEERRSSHSSHRSTHHSKPRKGEEEGKKKDDDGRKKEDTKHKVDDGRKKEEVKKRDDDGKKKEDVKKRDDDGKKKEDVKNKSDDGRKKEEAKKKDDEGKRKEDDARKRKDSHSSKNGKSDKPASSKDKEAKDVSAHRREKDGSKNEAGKERKDPVKDKSKATTTKEKAVLVKDKDTTQKEKDATPQKEKERREKERKAREAGKRKKAVDDHRGHRDRRSEDRRSTDGDSNGTARERPREASQSSRPIGSKEGRASEHGGQSGSSGGNSEQGEANQKAAKGSEKEKHRRSSSHGSAKRSPDAKLKITVRAPPPEAPPSPELRYFSDVDDSDLRGFSAFVARLTAEYERDVASKPKLGRPVMAGKAKAMEAKAKAPKRKANPAASQMPGSLTKELFVKVEQLVYKPKPIEPEAELTLTGKEPVLTKDNSAVDEAKPDTEKKPLCGDKERVSSDVSNETCALVSTESETDRVSVKGEPTDGSDDVPAILPDKDEHEIFDDRLTDDAPGKAGQSKINDDGIFKENDKASQLSKEHNILYGETSVSGSELAGAEKRASPVDREDEFPYAAKRARSSLDGAGVLAEKQYESRDFTVESGGAKSIEAGCVSPAKAKVYEVRDLTTSARPPSSASDGPRSRPQSRAENRVSEDTPRSRPSSSLEVRSLIEAECAKGAEGAEMRPPPAASSPATGRRSRQPSTRYSASDYSLAEAEAEGEEPARPKIAVGRKRSWPRDVDATDNNNERLEAGNGGKAVETPKDGQDETAEAKKAKVGRPRGRPPGSKKTKEPITETKLAVTDGRGKGREATPTFVMPLSPESDVSASSAELANRKAPSVSPTPAPPAPPATNKRATPAASSRAQRYSSDDLYKPRPLFSRGRRARGPQAEDGQ